MKSIIYSLVGLITFFVLSCSNDDHVDYEDKYTLEQSDRLVFEIDSVTKRNSRLVGYVEKLNSIYVFSDLNYTVYLFDIDTKQNWKKIRLAKDGPNGLGTVSKMIFVDIDSIYTFSRNSNRLFFIQDEGKTVRKQNILYFDQPDPTVQAVSPSVDFNSNNRTIYFPIRPNNRTSEERDKTLLAYDLNDNSRTFLKDWPESFERWGVLGMLSYGDVNEKNNSYVFSHSFEHDIQVMDLETTEIKSYYAGSKRVEIPGFISNGVDVADRIRYQKSGSWYGDILYDNFSSLYFRSAMIGQKIPGNEDPMAKKYPSLNGDDIYSSTVILNRNFEKVGEVSDLHIGIHAFSNEEGVFIRDYQFEPENEDILVFSKYLIKSKQ